MAEMEKGDGNEAAAGPNKRGTGRSRQPEEMSGACEPRHFVLVGLGNPGGRYGKTRHNLGFMAMDFWARRLGIVFQATPDLLAETARVVTAHGELLLVKPQTFMNRSGQCVARCLQRFPRAKLIVVHDDLDLPLGRMKIVANRGAGGHNGVRSIIAQLNSRDFVRLRIGIGAEQSGGADFVLSPFSPVQQDLVDQLMPQVADALQCMVEEGIPAAMNEFNRKG